MTTYYITIDDYDGPWKEGMDIYFKELMEFYFPEIAAKIDWKQGYEFLDKELQSFVRDADIGRRHADKLVKVWSFDAQVLYVLIHIEVQSDKDLDFSRRMYIYNYRIFDKSYLPVTILAILGDDHPSWRPGPYSFKQWGCELHFQFPMVKLLDYNDRIDELLKQSNPFAIITAAHLKTKTTKNNPEERYSWKWSIVMALYERGFSAADILQLYRLIDWLMILPEDLSQRFTDNLVEYEEDKEVTYVTSAERHGIKKGRIEGIEIGRGEGIEIGRGEGIEIGKIEGVEIGKGEGMLSQAREMVLDALDTKFSSNIPSDIEERIKKMTSRMMLKQLLRSAIQSSDIDSFRKSIDKLTSE
ncbi:hypothetical protein [Desulfonatronovibrio magnus]|uniref:hypothetical protein n=1 Tax=Desulfonatronovibrio magnus TaxID=698827 RepID=UPI0005EBC0D1|nr:hypothetical protein [Desulfonatronovibrio magnus]